MSTRQDRVTSGNDGKCVVTCEVTGCAGNQTKDRDRRAAERLDMDSQQT